MTNKIGTETAWNQEVEHAVSREYVGLDKFLIPPHNNIITNLMMNKSNMMVQPFQLAQKYNVGS